jgi:hypothetical protein
MSTSRRGQRLGISEYHELDQTRRLVLIRRDETEHLILIGGVQDLVIETGIGPGTHQSYVPSAPADDSPRAMVMRPPPRPPVFGERRPALRPVERDEPQLASSRPLEPEKGG